MKNNTDIKPGKRYIKPEIKRIAIDNLISLVMMTTIPGDPPPRGSAPAGNQVPFQSPFGDKPFG